MRPQNQNLHIVNAPATTQTRYHTTSAKSHFKIASKHTKRAPIQLYCKISRYLVITVSIFIFIYAKILIFA